MPEHFRLDKWCYEILNLKCYIFKPPSASVHISLRRFANCPLTHCATDETKLWLTPGLDYVYEGNHASKGGTWLTLHRLIQIEKWNEELKRVPMSQKFVRISVCDGYVTNNMSRRITANCSTLTGLTCYWTSGEDPGIFLIGGWGCLVLAIGEGRCYHKNPLTTQSVYVSKNRKYSRLPIIIK